MGYALLSTLGSMWMTQLKDADVANELLVARSQLFEQADVNLREAQACLSRYTVPVYHNELWTPIYIRKSAATTSAPRLTYGPLKALYGLAASGAPYNRVFNYGETLAGASNTVLPLPTGVVRIRAICNRVTDPSLMLMEGVNFLCNAEEGSLTLPFDVFGDPRVPTRIISTAGGGTDTEAMLWAYSEDVDTQLPWYFIGSVLGIRLETSQAAKDFMNAVWDLHTGAPHMSAFQQALSACWQVPLVAEDGETVELMLTGDSLQIITDKRVYTFDPDSVPLVAVGDVLRAGAALVDTLEIVDPRRVDGGTTLRRHQLTPQILDVGTVYTTSGLIKPADDALQYWQPFRLMRAGGRSQYADYFNNYYYPGIDPENPDIKPSADALFYDFSVGTYLTSGTDLIPEIYNGYYINDDVVVGRQNVGAHNYLKVEFDLLVGGEWRGNADALTWELLVNGKVVMSTNFSNVEGCSQAYPQSIGEGNNGRHTGARLSDIGIKQWIYSMGGNNAMYHLEVVVPHTQADARVEMRATGLPEGSWASVDPKELPTTRLAYDTQRVYHWNADKRNFPLFQGVKTQAQFISAYGYDPQVALTSKGIDLWSAHGNICYPQAFWAVKNMTITAITDTQKPINAYLPQIAVDPQIAGISLGPQYLYGNYLGSLYFINKDVPLQYVGLDSAGRAEVRFEVSGFPGDVEQYWQSVHAHGLAEGLTLANYLDKRVQPLGEPTAEDLPAVVNPMRLALRHILGYNLVIVKLKQGLEGQGALTSAVLTDLRKALPPQMSTLVFVSVYVDDEVITTPISDELVVAQGPVMEHFNGVEIVSASPIVQSIEGTL